MNYFWNSQFIAGVSHLGGGEGTYKDRTLQYIDPRGRNEMIRDMHRYFYFRDMESGLFWSPGGYPVAAAISPVIIDPVVKREKQLYFWRDAAKIFD